MPRAELTRRVGFTASHRYWRPDWSAERNRGVFGSAASESFHEHNYVCSVTVASGMDQDTGFVIGLDVLDALLAEEVTQRFAGRAVNDVAEFSEGGRAASGENLASFLFQRLERRMPTGVDLVSVTIAEDPTLSVTVRGGKA